MKKSKATPHNSRLAAQAPLRQLRHGICVAKMLDNVGLRYPHRASGAKAPRTLRPLPLLRFAASATGGAHLCSIQYYLRFWLSSCRTSLAVSALRIMRYCLSFQACLAQQTALRFTQKNSTLPLAGQSAVRKHVGVINTVTQTGCGWRCIHSQHRSVLRKWHPYRRPDRHTGHPGLRNDPAAGC